jgi:hypothetical protein
MSIPVTVQLFSGEILTFHLFPLCQIEMLCLEIAKLLHIERPQIILFDEDEEVNYNNLVESGITYRALINELIIQMTFERTIRLHHDYQELPKKAILEVKNVGHDAYRYMYNELLYVCGSDFDFEDETEIKNEEKFKETLKKYEIDEIDNDSFDFRDLDENLKIGLINAYFKECLTISLNIERYVFLDN